MAGASSNRSVFREQPGSLCLGPHEGGDKPKQAARANQYRTGKLGPNHPLPQSSQLWIWRCCRDLSQDDEYPGADQHTARGNNATELGQLPAPMSLANCPRRPAPGIVVCIGTAFKEPTWRRGPRRPVDSCPPGPFNRVRRWPEEFWMGIPGAARQSRLTKGRAPPIYPANHRKTCHRRSADGRSEHRESP
jgi:hypothetical protein